MKNKKFSRKIRTFALFLFLSALFLAVFSVATILIITISRMYDRLNPSEISFIPNHILPYLIVLVSLLVGSIITVYSIKQILCPLYRLHLAIDKVAGGDYTVRLTPRGPWAIRTVIKKFNYMVDEINNAEALRNDFINNFSHEFKTPIVSIEGFAKIIRNDEISKAEHDEFLDIIISESGRLAELSSNVLRLSRVENQAVLTHCQHFNVTEQLRLVIALLDQKWSRKNISIDFDCIEISLKGNEELLRQLWINLIDNAYKFSGENSVISISAKEDESSYIFRIADHGCGMSETDIRYAFDKFYQGDATHAEKGNGIGLSIAKKICELHSGTINISSDNNGTEVKVKLPKTI